MNTKFKLKALLMLVLFVTLASCSNEERSVLDVEEIEVQEVNLSAATTNGCTKQTKTRRAKYPGSDTDVNKRVSEYIDDRSCDYDYNQPTYGSKYGSYRIKAGGSTDDKEPRIERQGRTVSKVNIGNHVEISGICRIRSVGGSPTSQSENNKLSNKNGTYFLQAKGKHITPRGVTRVGPPDPAICLFIAKPIRVGGTLYYDIYREQIKFRGGSGNSGRSLFGPITRVKWNTDFNVKVRTGFDNRGPNGSLRHYVNSTINGVFKSFTVPDDRDPKEAKLRFGAYRCKSGSAQILWRNLGVKYKND